MGDGLVRRHDQLYGQALALHQDGHHEEAVRLARECVEVARRMSAIVGVPITNGAAELLLETIERDLAAEPSPAPSREVHVAHVRRRFHRFRWGLGRALRWAAWRWRVARSTMRRWRWERAITKRTADKGLPFDVGDRALEPTGGPTSPITSQSIEHVSGFLDLRSDAARRMELRARAALAGEDEDLARRLCLLMSQRRQKDDSADAEIKRIARFLDANGGEQRMIQICLRVGALGGSQRMLEIYWDGIGTWRA